MGWEPSTLKRPSIATSNREPSRETHVQATVKAEETTMPKSKKRSGKTEPAEDTQKLYARAYAARLAKQVREESFRRTAAPRKKPTAKK
jgi:hypothetical protein